MYVNPGESMKLVLLLLLSSTIVFAQTGTGTAWSVLNPYPTSTTLYLGSAPSADKYAVVTSQGELLMTTDGGTSWRIRTLPGDGIYRSLYFLNDNLGWAAGALNGKFSKTTDGGYTWSPITNAPDTTKYDIHFISQTTGWSVGFNGFIIKTTDGGDSWFSQSNTQVTSATLYGVCATDANTVYIAGNANAFVKSTDGGTTWAQMTLPSLGTTTDFRGVYFPPTGTGQTGFVVGHRTRILKTTDAGATWNAVLNAGGTTAMWGIHFNNQGVGLASGASGLVYRTTDMGSTWTQVTGLPTNIIFYNVRFASDNIAYLSGGSGHIYKSTDAGATWFSLSRRFTDSRLKDICFADNMNGWVVGSSGYVAKSTDGGYSFTPLTTGVTLELNEVSSPAPQRAYIAAYEAKVIRTTDGGATFSTLNTGLVSSTQLLAIDFVSPTTGYVAGTNGAVAKTTDGGDTWTNVSIPGSTSLLWDMDFVDADFGWICGTGEKIYATTNGGATWTEQLSFGGLGTYGISFANRTTGVAGGTGGNTFFTANGGATWTQAITEPAQTVWGIHIVESPNGTVAMAACASGYAYISTDGGKVWTQEPRFTISTFDDVWMTDAAHAWISGNSGAVLGYYEPSNVPVELTSLRASVSGSSVTLSWQTATEQNNKEFIIERTRTGSPEYISIGSIAGRGTTTEPGSYSFTDNNLLPGIYQYRLVQNDFDGSSSVYPLAETIEITPLEFALLQNYPNPFNPSTVLTLTLPQSSHVRLDIYDITGRKIQTLVNENLQPGTHTAEFNASAFSSGIYIAKITAGSYSQTVKMTYLK